MAHRLTDTIHDFTHLHERPAREDRLFQSDLIERVIEKVSGDIGDDDVRRMFSQCLPNALDTTVYYRENENGREKDAFIVTGDIPAMWLRDSTNQLWPYLRFIDEDKELQNLFIGL